MNDVFLAWEGDLDERYVAAVYGSLEAAQAAHAGHGSSWLEADNRWRCAWQQAAVPPKRAVITYKRVRHRVVDGAVTLRDGSRFEVLPGVSSVIEAVLPQGTVTDYGSPARYCDFVIERMEMTA
jgi:hypothetical protein